MNALTSVQENRPHVSKPRSNLMEIVTYQVGKGKICDAEEVF